MAFSPLLPLLLAALVNAQAARAPAPPPAPQQVLKRSAELKDKGDAEGALRVLTEALAKEPGNDEVRYQLASSLYERKDYEGARKLAAEGVARKSPLAPSFHALLGMSLFGLKKTDEAVKAFEAGIAIAPENADLRYNLASALFGKGDLKRAREELKKALAIAPDDASSHLLLADVYRADGYRIPAFLVYLRFLGLEPKSDRTKDALGELETLMLSGVEKSRRDPAQLEVNLKGTKNRDEGDFSDAEAILSVLAAATAMSEEEKARSESERFVRQLQAFTGFLKEVPTGEDAYVGKAYIPFAAELRRRELVEPLGYVVASTAGKEGAQPWLEQNAERVEEALKFAREWRPAKIPAKK